MTVASSQVGGPSGDAGIVGGTLALGVAGWLAPPRPFVAETGTASGGSGGGPTFVTPEFSSSQSTSTESIVSCAPPSSSACTVDTGMGGGDTEGAGDSLERS